MIVINPDKHQPHHFGGVGVYLFKMATKQMKNIFILLIIVIAIFGIIDSQQIVLFQISQDWANYLVYIAPNFILSWVLVFAGIAITYYLLKKNKVQAIGIFLSGYTMLLLGTEDLFFYLLSPNTMATQMCWFSSPINLISSLMGEICVSPLSLVLNALLGIYLGWVILKWFFNRK